MRAERSLLVLAAASLVAAACSAGGGSAALPAAAGPTSPAVQASCLAGDPEAAKHVTHFPAADGEDQVEAYTLGTGPVGVVLAHQSGADLCQWEPMMLDFTAKGYRVMAITLGGHIDADVVAAAGRLRQQGATKIALIGASMGGTAVLAAAPKLQPAPAGVVSLSGPTAYVVDALPGVKTMTVPVFYVAGSLDSRFAADAQTLYAATTESDKKIDEVTSGDHGVDLWPAVEAEIFQFLARVTRG